MNAHINGENSSQEEKINREVNIKKIQTRRRIEIQVQGTHRETERNTQRESDTYTQRESDTYKQRERGIQVQKEQVKDADTERTRKRDSDTHTDRYRSKQKEREIVTEGGREGMRYLKVQRKRELLYALTSILSESKVAPGVSNDLPWRFDDRFRGRPRAPLTKH